MFKHLLFVFVLLVHVHDTSAQHRWKDPLSFDNFDIIDKHALLYNIGGIFLSDWLDKQNDYARYWELGLFAQYHEEYDVEESVTEVFIGKARLGRQLHRWLQAGVEGQIFHFDKANIATWGFGGAVYFNWYFLNRDCFKLYFDNGFGIVGTTKPFPEGGTSFNFSISYGLSSSFRISPDTFLSLGLYNMHISNAWLFGDHNNPAFDSFGVQVGVTF